METTLKDGDLVWDTKFKEKFILNLKTDRMILDRLEIYTNQDQ